MVWQLQAILEELVAIAKSQYARHPRLTLATGFVAALLLLKGTGCVAAALFSMRPPAEFAFRRVAGRITYADGSAIPAQGMLVCFAERQTADAAGGTRSLGCTTTDATAGTFSTTLRLPSHVRPTGPVVVAITSAAGDPLPADVIPPEYATAETSPLVADVTSWSLDLRVRKP